MLCKSKSRGIFMIVKSGKIEAIKVSISLLSLLETSMELSMIQKQLTPIFVAMLSHYSLMLGN